MFSPPGQHAKKPAPRYGQMAQGGQAGPQQGGGAHAAQLVMSLFQNFAQGIMRVIPPQAQPVVAQALKQLLQIIGQAMQAGQGGPPQQGPPPQGPPPQQGGPPQGQQGPPQ